MNPPPLLELPQDLSPNSAMALFDLFSALTDAIWQQYESDLVELIVEQLHYPPGSQQAFDFDDDLPF